MLHHIRSTHEADDEDRHDGGFTLIELLVVVIILGILAAVVVFAVRGISDESRVASCRTEGRTVKTAVEAYNARNGSYPTGIAQLVGDGGDFLESQPKWWTYAGGVNGDVKRDLFQNPDAEDYVSLDECPESGQPVEDDDGG